MHIRIELLFLEVIIIFTGLPILIVFIDFHLRQTADDNRMGGGGNMQMGISKNAMGKKCKPEMKRNGEKNVSSACFFCFCIVSRKYWADFHTDPASSTKRKQRIESFGPSVVWSVFGLLCVLHLEPRTDARNPQRKADLKIRSAEKKTHCFSDCQRSPQAFPSHTAVERCAE